MNCPSCGAEVPVECGFCTSCGVAIHPMKVPATTQRHTPGGSKALLLFGGSVLVVLGLIGFCVFAAILGALAPKQTALDATPAQEQTTVATAPTVPVGPRIGEMVQAGPFLVQVASVAYRDQVGGRYDRQTAPPGSVFCVLYVYARNTDTESRMFLEGDLLTKYQGKTLKYDKTETVLGLTEVLLTMNPLTEKTFYIIYEIPDNLPGPFFWRPGRGNTVISLYQEHVNGR